MDDQLKPIDALPVEEVARQQPDRLRRIPATSVLGAEEHVGELVALHVVRDREELDLAHDLLAAGHEQHPFLAPPEPGLRELAAEGRLALEAEREVGAAGLEICRQLEQRVEVPLPN